MKLILKLIYNFQCYNSNKNIHIVKNKLQNEL